MSDSPLIATTGPKGDDGSPATADAGVTTTLADGEDATVDNVGTVTDAVFDFGIPRGIKGDQGAPGGVAVDGGNAASVYTPPQLIDGGSASG